MRALSDPTQRIREFHRSPATLASGATTSCMVTLAKLTRGAWEGSNRASLSGRISGRALASGRYQARFTAIDSAGVSRPQTLGFTIVR